MSVLPARRHQPLRIERRIGRRDARRPLQAGGCQQLDLPLPPARFQLLQRHGLPRLVPDGLAVGGMMTAFHRQRLHPFPTLAIGVPYRR